MSEEHAALLKRIDLPVTGMSCASCASHLQSALSDLKGVSEASVNFAAEKATVVYDPLKASIADFTKAIIDQGYGVSVSRLILPVKGITCASCVSAVESALRELDGVVSVSVNFATEKATLEYFPSQVGIREFKKVVKDAGYDVVEAERGEDIVEKERQ